MLKMATLKVGTNMGFVLKGKNRSYRLICHGKDVFVSLLIVFDIVKVGSNNAILWTLLVALKRSKAQ